MTNIKPAYISVVCPLDNDVFQDNINHYIDLGISDFYIMLHNPDAELTSTKGALPCLDNCNFTFFENLTDEHHHDKDCKILTDAAMADGFNWIIGSDADELLVLKKHKTIQEFIAEYDNYDSIELQFKWYNYLVTKKDVYPPDNAFNEMVMRDELPLEQNKSIGKFDSEMAYVPGLHLISKSKTTIVIDPLVACYCHFSARNEKQFVNKMKLQAVNWHNRYGKHTHWAEKMLEENPFAMEKKWKADIKNNKNNESLIYDPITRS